MNSDETQFQPLEPEQPQEPEESLEASDNAEVSSVTIEPIAEEHTSEESAVEEEGIPEEPVVAELVAEEPLIAEPVVEEPLVAETVAEQIVVEEPVAIALSEVAVRVAELQQQEQALREEIANLQASYNQTLQAQVAQTQAALNTLVQEALSELEQRKQALQISIEQLEKRRDRIREEMRKSFAGVSQELAIRVQGFKDYLVGSLQDLAVAAEELELPTGQEPVRSPQLEILEAAASERTTSVNPQFTEQSFQATGKKIRSLIDQYRTVPDYYGPPWQLRRTFEPVHAERVSNWFFTQGGRGAVRSMGSRLQNTVVTSAVISILRSLYGDRLRTLVLANSPERLGEWRRGLQDCLGISRTDFGPERGIVLFEDPEPLVIKAERLTKQKQMPFIMIDETENEINLSLLEFPLWLAFAPDPQQMSADFRF